MTPTPSEPSSRRPVADYELVDHGVKHEQYFSGRSVDCAGYTDVATGVGSDPRAAFDDALDQLACNGWDADALERLILTKLRLESFPLRPAATRKDHHYYLSIRVKGGAA